MGWEAGFSITTGIRNNIFGEFAGKKITTGQDNNIFGYYAANNITTGSDNNIFGNNAAGYPLAAGTESNDNNIMGKNAAYYITTGSYNNIFGKNAAYDITTGAHNNISGYKAGYNLTTGAHNNIMGYEAASAGIMTGNGYNNIMGYEAGYNMTSGTYNNIFGWNAGWNINTGDHNILVGYQAGKSITSGERNYFIGVQAGLYVSGSNNIAIGSHTCGSGNSSPVTSGNYNINMGHKAGYLLTGGQYNNLFGYEAGKNISSGGYNTAVGFRTLESLTTGSNNTAIGYEAGKSNPVGAQNTICIGNGANVTASNMCRIGNDSIKVGIGTSSPDATFVVDTGTGTAYDGIKLDADGETRCVMFTDDAANGGNGYFSAYDNTETTKVHFDSNGWSYLLGGNLGIGTSSPELPLDVARSIYVSDAGIDQYWDRGVDDGFFITSNNVGYKEWGSGYQNYIDSYSGGDQGWGGDLNDETSVDSDRPVNLKPISAHFYDYIYCSNGGILMSSDERIKCNIKEFSDPYALRMLRDISCVSYNYKDVTKQEEPTIGFIAQQVKTVLPEAINFERRFIPDQLKILNVSWDGLKMSWTKTDISRNLLDESGNEVDVSGVKYQFFVKNDLSDKEVKISAIGNEDGTFTFDKSYNYVFCYGKEVDDFHSLDKQKLFTVNFSATQEIDRRQKIHKLDINNLKIDLVFAEAKITALEAENVTLKARLDTIEARLNAGGL
jgi:hypothetical protein